MFFDLDEWGDFGGFLPGGVTLLLPNLSTASRSRARTTSRRSASARRSWRRRVARSCSRAPTLPAAPMPSASKTSRQGIREGADLVLDGGELPGVPSTVIDLRTPEWRIVRQGAAPGQQVEPTQEEQRGSAMRRAWVIAACAAGLVAPASASADAGRSAVAGGSGVSTWTGRVNFVAVSAGRDTMIQRVVRNGGVVERTRLIGGHYGIPAAAVDGSTTGLSADGRTLVLAERTSTTKTRLLVLDTETLRTRKRIALPEFLSVDAISPDGRTLYVLRYPKARRRTT